jgi:hypothetical protein
MGEVVVVTEGGGGEEESAGTEAIEHEVEELKEAVEDLAEAVEEATTEPAQTTEEAVAHAVEDERRFHYLEEEDRRLLDSIITHEHDIEERVLEILEEVLSDADAIAPDVEETTDEEVVITPDVTPEELAKAESADKPWWKKLL